MAGLNAFEWPGLAPLSAMTFGSIQRFRQGPSFRLVEVIHAPGTVLPRHEHADVSLGVVLTGGLDERVGRLVFTRGAGSLLVHPAGVEHTNKYSLVATHSVMIQISPTSPLLREWAGRSPERMQRLDAGDVRALGLRIQQLVIQPIDAVALEQEVAGIVAAFMPPVRRPVSTAARRMALVREELLDGAARVPLSAIAARHNLTLSALTHAFRRQFDCTPSAMVRRRRLDRAAALLRDPALTLSEIAIRSGFADQAHLTREFRRLTGLSPGRYRNTRR